MSAIQFIYVIIFCNCEDRSQEKVWEKAWKEPRSLIILSHQTNPGAIQSLLSMSQTVNVLTIWAQLIRYWKRLWCWEGLGAGGEGNDRGWDGWMASLTRWTWVWVNSGSWWWTRRPGVLWFMKSQRVGHDWATELNWTELNQVFGHL